MSRSLLDIVNEVRNNSGLDSLEKIGTDLNLKEDIELDSISMAELIALIDVNFNVDVNADGMVQTIGDIESQLEKQA